MKDRISQLMDGELDDRAAAETIGALRPDGEALQAWRTYHLIGDALRESRVLSAGFSARFAERLASEATVLAPQRARPESRTWLALSAAASFAAVALVGWLAFAPQPGVAPAPAPVAQAAPAMAPSVANDYLLAHQGFSPRVSIQGMAPYVRTVSEQTREPRR
ncbi:MAG TPA: sigma-E factor negative regulatory protein [Burkholderiales bacterium]|jgi:sigma-E factor negative regulatory protein RseA